MKHLIKFSDEYTINRKVKIETYYDKYLKREIDTHMYYDTYIFSGNATIEINSCYKDGYFEELTQIEENSRKAITDMIKAGIVINKDEFFTNENLLKDYMTASANRNKTKIIECQITRVTKQTTREIKGVPSVTRDLKLPRNSTWTSDAISNEKER